VRDFLLILKSSPEREELRWGIGTGGRGGEGVIKGERRKLSRVIPRYFLSTPGGEGKRTPKKFSRKRAFRNRNSKECGRLINRSFVRSEGGAVFGGVFLLLKESIVKGEKRESCNFPKIQHQKG